MACVAESNLKEDHMSINIFHRDFMTTGCFGLSGKTAVENPA